MATEAIGWTHKRQCAKASGVKRRGVGMAAAMHVSGNRTIGNWDGSTLVIKINEDGRVFLISGECDMGQGASTMLSQIVAHELDLPLADIHVLAPDTDVSPVAVGTLASRVTMSGGNAAIIAAREAGLLVAGGGHAMAAGLTVAPNQLDALGEWLDARLSATVTAAMANQAMLLDLAVAPGGLTPALIEDLESAGPYGMGWPGPRVAVGPVRMVKADIVGTDHVRLIARGEDGASFKAIAFRAASSELGQTLLHATHHRRLWLAGRARIDDWSSRPAAELHIDDAAFAD